MDKRIFILVVGVIAAAAGTIVIAALVAPQLAGFKLSALVLLITALILLLIQRRQKP